MLDVESVFHPFKHQFGKSFSHDRNEEEPAAKRRKGSGSPGAVLRRGACREMRQEAERNNHSPQRPLASSSLKTGGPDRRAHDLAMSETRPVDLTAPGPAVAWSQRSNNTEDFCFPLRCSLLWDVGCASVGEDDAAFTKYLGNGLLLGLALRAFPRTQPLARSGPRCLTPGGGRPALPTSATLRG
jgi:hypothetical protein